MSSRFAVYALVATVLVGGTAFAADALVVSDTEHVEQLADALESGEAVDAVLRWTDPSREEVSVGTGGRPAVFGEGEDVGAARAVERALGELDAALEKEELPLRFGTLVVFTDGTDRAARVPQQEMLDAVNNSNYSVFAIGLGAEIDEEELDGIGRDGTAKAYSTWHLDTHEIVNDVIDGEPIAATW